MSESGSRPPADAFAIDARAWLDAAINLHRLRFVRRAPDEVALVGDAFALVLAEAVDDVAVTYVVRDDAGRPIAFDIGTWIGHRFTPAERALYGSPASRPARARAALRVVAAGLTRHFADLLDGDREWLRRERRRDAAAWTGRDGTSYASLLPPADAV